MTKKIAYRKGNSNIIKKSIRKIGKPKKELPIPMNSSVFLLRKMNRVNHLVLFLKNVVLI